MDFRRQREQLVDRLRTQREVSERTLDAIHAVPRHLFVPEPKQNAAYQDTPLPIGQGQTISAPHMVAMMTDLLDLERGTRVLEIGTGCGYHAAVTAEVVGEENVYSVEYHEELVSTARETLAAAGYEQISVRHGDGRNGWPKHAPYDRSYLTCAASAFPDAVSEQLHQGAILLGPIRNGRQVLVRATVTEDGELEREEHGYVRFVPLQ